MTQEREFSKWNETYENQLLLHFIAYLNFTQNVLGHITQKSILLIRNIRCYFWKEVRTTQPGKISPFEI